MLLTIPDVLTGAQLAACRHKLTSAHWEDGKQTAGHIAVNQKKNSQLSVHDPLAIEIGDVILDALSTNALFISATLPSKVLAPMFNRYSDKDTYGFHIDNAIRVQPGSNERIRADISATLFLNEPDTYEGGELLIADNYGEHRVKLPAGHLVVYPGTSLHQVTPVTGGVRLAAFFWIQSMVRDDGQRTILFNMDQSIQQLTRELGEHRAVTQLTGVYHNLVRSWADI